MSSKHIVIAPDSFKESMTAKQAADSILEGFRNVFSGDVTFDLIPMADGGEGTTQSLADALEGKMYEKVVTGPLGDYITASYAISGDHQTAIIEMAEASGLAYVPRDKRNPLRTTTYGTGELIQAALDHGIKKIILCIGGSATNDGGAGMIEALGGVFYSKQQETIGWGGGALRQLQHIDLTNLDPRLKHVEFVVACDVDNPLLGPRGASAIFGPQKGADEDTVKILDDALRHYHDILYQVTGKDVKDIPGAGAAGGLGAGLLACLNTELKRGIDIVLQETNFYERVKGANIVITGEGKIDGQTIYGKTPIGVSRAAKRASANVIALCGTLGEGYEKVYEHGIDAVFSISEGPEDLDTALQNGPDYLKALARNIATLLTF